MTDNRDKLSQLLKQWRDIEPPASFQADVRRRIRLAQTEELERVTVAEWLQRLLWRPAPALAVAVVASILLGSSIGLLTAPPTSAARGELRFLSAGTLAGGYLHMGTERVR